MTAVSHAQNQNVLRRARDLYATYCASSDGKNYQGLPCPDWDALTEAVRGHWYTVALRSLHLGRADHIRADGMCEAAKVKPDNYALGHLPDPDHALDVWKRYSGLGSHLIDDHPVETPAQRIERALVFIDRWIASPAMTGGVLLPLQELRVVLCPP